MPGSPTESSEREKKILFVDDAEMFRELGSLFLSRSGRVATAASGEAGFDLARALRPDVIVVDLLMPGLEGDAFCQRVKQDPDLRETPVVVLVGVEDPRAWGRAVRAGADDVLAKPLSRIALVQAMNRLLASPTPRGLPRVAVDSAVRLEGSEITAHGRVRNLSRGGLFVDTPTPWVDPSEVGLRFALPETDTRFDPTARVVWHRRATARGGVEGFGMRFVDISSALVRQLDDYVFDRTPHIHTNPPAAPGTGVPT